MDIIKVNLENLSENDKKQLFKLVEKSKKSVTLSDIAVGETFKIGDIEFIKFADEYGVTTAVTKECIFTSAFGKNNNLAESEIYKKLNAEVLPEIENIIGAENIFIIDTDLTTLDGLKPYPKMTSKISLPTLDFYRKNVEMFDKYKVGKWWWLATPESAKPHDEPNWVVCVAPSGNFGGNDCGFNYGGVRPFCVLKSSISVS